MLLIDEIIEDYSFRKDIVSQIEHIEDIEMSEHDSAFLCGLIKKFAPKKILEVGVAAGGTTAIILKCLEENGEPYQMYSVDINSFYYRKPHEKCGYLAEEAIKKLNHGTHKFLFGTGIASHLDDIGNEIDFVILDTAHSLPGEILDFLVIFPFLSTGAVVCLHDIALTQYKVYAEHSYCTAMLLSAVSGDKMINMDSLENDEYSYPNIGAFRLTDETKRNLANLLMALTLRWQYFPSSWEMDNYYKMIRRYYDKQLCTMFDKAVKMNAKRIINSKFKDLCTFPPNTRVLVYGAGVVGRSLLGLIKYVDNVELVGCVDKNYKSIGFVDGIEVQSADEIDISAFDYIIVAIVKEKIATEVVDYLQGIGVARERIKLIG
ncbi:hypothetical protein D081_1066 [Anaerovibrio sp. JC8]|uniref:class I SAM-dependent methyltransferase n=1 Tax=Anaerovibrio sp. JC8 TaxID=1240085 RepID=UPI000A0D19C4|nr:class I SAM-dependent methyltransferase [Anaerovibrio sp. JC8]ORU00543.1 hypothetical protein D081_1066 [Anaerovibrio sp. JC8]